MPKDSSGKFHLNPQRAAHASKLLESHPAVKKTAPAPAGRSIPPPPDPDGDAGDDATSSTTLHANGDGSFRSDEGGVSTEHPTLGHALVHIAMKHGSDGKHMHIHSDAMGGHVTHHGGDGGEVEGPHEHGDIEALKDHVGTSMGDSVY